MSEMELYIHIPFCLKKCNYCDFLSVSADEQSQYEYMEGLKREIAFYGSRLSGKRLDTIYIGGGTPSWMQEDYIMGLMHAVSRSFFIEKDAEITIECNPGTLTKKKLECYQSLGINRLSIGLQSADNAELKLLGRIHTFEQFLRNYELAREYGFSNINIDLMDSIPYQTEEKLYQTLMKTINLRPEHISCYSLILEKGTPFYEQFKFDMVKQRAGMNTEILPNENAVYRMGKMTQAVLAENGYEQYEISNYAKKGYSCRHNIGYWKRVEYLGAGLGADSLLGEVRYGNIRDLQDYICKSMHIEETEILDEKQEKMIIGTNLHARASQLNQKMQMEEFMFLGFRMTEGIEKSRFYRKFGLPVDFVYQETLKKLTSEGLLIETPTRLYLTEKGMDLNNYVAAQFLL